MGRVCGVAMQGGGDAAALCVGDGGHQRCASFCATAHYHAQLTRGEFHQVARWVDAQYLDDGGRHRSPLVVPKHLAGGILDIHGCADCPGADACHENIGHAQHLGEFIDLRQAPGVAAAITLFMVLANGLQPCGVGDACLGEQCGTIDGMCAQLGALPVQHGIVLARHLALQVGNARIHGEGGQGDDANACGGPVHALRHEDAQQSGVDAVAVTIPQVPGLVLADRHEDGDIGIQVGQRDQLLRQFFYVGGEFRRMRQLVHQCFQGVDGIGPARVNTFYRP